MISQVEGYLNILQVIRGKHSSLLSCSKEGSTFTTSLNKEYKYCIDV